MQILLIRVWNYFGSKIFIATEKDNGVDGCEKVRKVINNHDGAHNLNSSKLMLEPMKNSLQMNTLSKTMSRAVKLNIGLRNVFNKFVRINIWQIHAN